MRPHAVRFLLGSLGLTACHSGPPTAADIEEGKQPAIYGTDDRLDYFEITNEAGKQAASGVGLVIPTIHLTS
jgi:hypothetical protein